MIAGLADTTQDVSKLRFIVNKAQQRLATCTPRADAENIFCRWVKPDDKQATVQQNDAATQAVENALRLFVEVCAATGMLCGLIA